MVELRAAGERLGKLEIGKKQAILHEDYSKAKKKKAQMDDYRKEVYALLEVDDLLEENGVWELYKYYTRLLYSGDKENTNVHF